MIKKLFARYPIPTVEELRDGMIKFSETTKKSFNNSLDTYTKGVVDDIASSQKIILREKQRIKKAKKCIGVARVLMNENGSSKAKFITKKYYDNLLFDAISEANSKFLC